ncbi:MAG TPA: hypothetical protein VHF25_16630 [Nitriliruptorales bacterium]|nr:hypothetical protein [Nitriliruptorales bacterium]
MGANTYRLMSGFAADSEASAEEATDENAATAALANVPKLVFSSTLQAPLSWANTPAGQRRCRRGCTGDEATGTNPMRTLGASPSAGHSSRQASWTAPSGRADVSQRLTGRAAQVAPDAARGLFPVITGKTGRDRIYDSYPDVSLDMVASRTFDGSLQLLEYVPPQCSLVRPTRCPVPDGQLHAAAWLAAICLQHVRRVAAAPAPASRVYVSTTTAPARVGGTAGWSVLCR